MKIKNFYSFCFLLTLLMSLPGWTNGDLDGGEAGNSCDMNEYNFGDLISTMVPGKCLEIGFLRNPCKCLSKEVKTNVGTEMNVKEGKEAIDGEIQKSKQPYRDQFARVYNKVTIQAAAQEEVLGISDNTKPVGCTPKDISFYIQGSATKTINDQVLALEKLHQDAEAKLKTCQDGGILTVVNFKMNANGCEFYEGRKEIIERKILKIKASSCDFAVNAFNNEDSRRKIQAISDSPEFKLPQNSKMRAYVKVWESYLNGEVTSQSLISGFKNDCTALITSFNELTEFHEKNVVKYDVNGGVKLPNSLNSEVQCSADDKICQTFAEKNKDLLKNTLRAYVPKDDDCVTFAEYATYKGMPEPKLLQDLAASDHPEELLDDRPSNSKNKERIRFLQANPLIAVVARGGDKALLGQALKTMATGMLANKNGGKAADFKGYLDFMKGPFKDIYNEADSANMNVCTELARNYTAIEISDNLPPLPKSDGHGSDRIKLTKQLVRKCIGKVYEGTNTAQLDASLKLSPIYSLGDMSSNPEPTVEKFEDFKKDYCKGYTKHKADACAGKGMDECRKTFMPEGQVTPVGKMMAAAGANSLFGANNIGHIAAKHDVTKQDQVKKDWWQKEYGSKLNQSALMGSNDRGEFAAAMQSNQRIASSPDIESRYQSFINSGIPSFSNPSTVAETMPSSIDEGGFSRSSEDSKQVRPDFNASQSVIPPVPNFKSIPPEQIKEATEITKLDPVFDSRTDVDKLSTYKALEKYKDESGISPDFNVSENIKELEENIAKKKEEIKEIVENKNDIENKKENVASVGSQNGRFPASFGQSSFSAPISNSPILGQFPRSSSMSGGKISKGEASYQAALLQKHQMSDLQIIVQGSNAEGPYVIPEKNIISSDDVYPFDDLKNPNKLSEFLAVKLGGSVENGESVKIVNPKTNDYFVMKATKKDGILSYQLIPFVQKEKIRMVTLGGLNNEIDVIKNK